MFINSKLSKFVSDELIGHSKLHVLSVGFIDINV